jgi:hypothetical protein
MALRLFPFRQYAEQDVVNLFANAQVDTDPSTNSSGSAGVFVKVLAGDLNQDPVGYATHSYLGKTNYPYVGAAQYPTVPLTFGPATNDAPVLGVTLNQTLAQDENGEKLLYYPQKTAELQAILSGQACPVLTKGMITLSADAIDWVYPATATAAAFSPGNFITPSANKGKITGRAYSATSTGNNVVIGQILATGNRISQTSESDQFAGTTTGNYAIVLINCQNVVR